MKNFNNILLTGLAIAIALAHSFSPVFAQGKGKGKNRGGSGFTANGGYWNNANDWSGGQVPTSTDNVSIEGDMIVDQNGEAQDIQFKNNKLVTVNAGDTLIIYGNFNGIDGGTQKPNFDVQGTLIIKGDVNAIKSGGDFDFTGDGSISVEGNINMDNGASVDYTGNGSFTVGGEISGNGSVTVNGETYGEARSITVAAGETYTILNGDVFIDIIIEDGGVLNAPTNGSFTVSGNFTNNGTYNNNGANVTFDGADMIIAGTSTTAFDTVNFNNSTILNATVEVIAEANVNGTLDTDLTNANAELVMQSDATQTAGFYNNGTLNGNIVMERYISGGKYGHYIAAPVQMPVNEFAPSQAAYRFNAKIGRWARVNTANTFTEGLGYNIGLKEETVLRYKGKPNGNTVSLTLNKSNRNSQGYNLVGNPFPFPIVWNGSDALAASGTIYAFDADQTTYVEIDAFSNAVIEPGQAFFVKADTNNVTLTFSRPEMSLKQANTSEGRSFFRVMNVKPEFLKLNVSLKNTDFSDKAMFLFDDQAQTGYDFSEDADHRAGWGKAPEFYSLVEGKKLALNALPRINENDTVTIPLFVKIKQQGEYMLNLDQQSLANLPEDLNINLYDSVKEQSFNLRDVQSINFMANENKVTERFVLTLTKGIEVEETVAEDTIVVQDTVAVEDTLVAEDTITASTEEVEEPVKGTVEGDAADTVSVTTDTVETVEATDTVTTEIAVADTTTIETKDSVTVSNEEVIADTVAVEVVQDTVAVENTDSVAVDSAAADAVENEVATDSTTAGSTELMANNHTNASDTVTAVTVNAGSDSAINNENNESSQAVAQEKTSELVNNTSFQQVSASDLRLHGSNRQIKIWLPEALQSEATFVVYGLNGNVYNSLELDSHASITQVLSVPANGIYIVNMIFNGQTIQKRVMVR